MQFLESVAEKLNKVDQLAAEVAVVAAKDKVREKEDEGEEDASDELNPEAMETADAIEALAARLGDWDAEVDDHDAKSARDGGDVGGDSGDGVSGTRSELTRLLSELRQQEAETAEAVRLQEEAVAELAEDAAMHEREEADASEELRRLERAVAAEQAAHASTRAQASDREAALHSDATEYDGMVTAVQRQTAEKNAAAAALEARAAEAAENESGLLRETEAAEEEAAAGDDGKAAAESAAGSIRQRMSELRAAVAEAEEEAATLKREEAAKTLEGARYPSQAERERELERRLASLNSQLIAKRAQAEALARAKADLERRLRDATQERRRLQQRQRGEGGIVAHDGGTRTQRGGGGLKRRVAGSGWGGPSSGREGDGTEDGAKEKNQSSLTGLGVRSRVKQAAETVDSLSVRAGRHLRRSVVTRSLVIVYVLAVHTIAFVILAVRAMLHAPA